MEAEVAVGIDQTGSHKRTGAGVDHASKRRMRHATSNVDDLALLNKDLPVMDFFTRPGPDRTSFDHQRPFGRWLKDAFACDENLPYVCGDFQRIAGKDEEIGVHALGGENARWVQGCDCQLASVHGKVVERNSFRSVLETFFGTE